jgi:AAA+ ATPase superfamily predicted ATPase
MFGRDEEFKEIGEQLDAGFWPILIGAKRVGKTSIMKVITEEQGGIYIDASTSIKASDIGTRMVEEIRRNRIRIGEVKLDFKIVQAELKKDPIRTLEGILKGMGEKIIAIDEAQSLNDPTLPKLFSVLYNETEIKFMFSGSATGLLKRLERGTQMLGRPIQQEEIKPFDTQTAKEFLKTGFKLCKVSHSEEEINDTVGTFGGIPGWLAYYGAKRSQNISHQRSIAQVKQLAKGVVEEECASLGPIQTSIIVALVSLGPSGSWSEIKALARSAYGGKEIDDKSLSRSLQTLVDLRIIAKTEKDRYHLLDPLYKLIQKE